MRKLALGVGALAALTACDDTLFNTETPDTGPMAEGYCGAQQLLEAECATCHGDGNPSAGLDLVTDLHAATVNVTGSEWGQVLVVPGDKESSFLYLKMTDRQGESGAVMPMGGALDPDKLAIIGDWIESGASSDCAEGDADTDADADTDTDTDTDVAGTWCATEAIFTSQGCVDCHDSGAAGYSHLDFTADAYPQLVLQPATGSEGAVLVVPGYPEASLLYRKVSHTVSEGEGDVMPPPEAPKLDDAYVQSVYDWIAAGAIEEDCAR